MMPIIICYLVIGFIVSSVVVVMDGPNLHTEPKHFIAGVLLWPLAVIGLIILESGPFIQAWIARYIDFISGRK